jgi:hypothetical protein
MSSSLNLVEFDFFSSMEDELLYLLIAPVKLVDNSDYVSFVVFVAIYKVSFLYVHFSLVLFNLNKYSLSS